MQIVGVVVCTNRIVKMKEHLSFFREFSILFIEDRAAVDRLSNFEKESILKESAF